MDSRKTDAYKLMDSPKTDAYKLMDSQKKTDAYKLTDSQKTDAYELMDSQKTDAYEPLRRCHLTVNDHRFDVVQIYFFELILISNICNLIRF